MRHVRGLADAHATAGGARFCSGEAIEARTANALL